MIILEFFGIIAIFLVVAVVASLLHHITECVFTSETENKQENKENETTEKTD